ncbi:xanthine dehydrogenase accessory factor [Arthrobacter globiformis]|uniref:XdhC family protein n=1 Tax=Arthrobacter globiformis TaxID=1665 RepID=UPI00278ADA68|nr:XdhC/CoxI family protein [Arthrobacter globiformis]MDQ1060177.1 xanthine dehydrogenase accessory factor [Arthrobacter globiformis]
MLDLMPSLAGWRPAASGERCAVATIITASGSVPRPTGTSMLVSESGEILGSLSGGCVEAAVVASALEVMADGGTRLEAFGFSSEDAFAVGLTCGGELEVHIQPLDGNAAGLGDLRKFAAGDPGRPLALIRRIDGASGRSISGGTVSGSALGAAGAQAAGAQAAGAQAAGAQATGTPGAGTEVTARTQPPSVVVVPDPGAFEVAGSAELAALLGLDALNLDAGARWEALLAAAAQLEPLLRGGRTGLVRLAPPQGCGVSGRGARGTDGGVASPEPVTLLVESRLPQARLLVFGANDFGAALVPAAKLLGYRVTLCDARPAFAAQERFAAADEVATDWPHRYLAAEAAAGRIDSRSVICVLTHDPKFDIPLLQEALELDVAFVGALGSRRSHRQRIDGLLEAGVAPEKLARLHSPIGLDLGAVTPAEVAVSITAELIAARSGAVACTPLRDGTGPIHSLPEAGSAHAEPAFSTEQASQEIAWT